MVSTVRKQPILISVNRMDARKVLCNSMLDEFRLENIWPDMHLYWQCLEGRRYIHWLDIQEDLMP